MGKGSGGGGVVGRGGEGGLEFGLGAQPGEGFVDALLQRNLGRAGDGIGFVHRGDIVGGHGAVAGRGDVEGFAGQDGDDIVGEAGSAKGRERFSEMLSIRVFTMSHFDDLDH